MTGRSEDKIFSVPEIEIAAGPMDSHLQALGMKTDEKYTAADILKAYRWESVGWEVRAMLIMIIMVN